MIHSRTTLLSMCPAIKEWELPEYIQNPSIMGLDLGTFTLCGVSRPRTWWGHNLREELYPVAVALMLEVNSLTPGCGAQSWSLKITVIKAGCLPRPAVWIPRGAPSILRPLSTQGTPSCALMTVPPLCLYASFSNSFIPKLSFQPTDNEDNLLPDPSDSQKRSHKVKWVKYLPQMSAGRTKVQLPLPQASKGRVKKWQTEFQTWMKGNKRTIRSFSLRWLPWNAS